MRRTSRLVTSVAVAGSCLALAVSWVCAQDAVAVSGGANKVLKENDQVRVYEFNVKAGSTSAVHSHPAHLAYGLTDCKLKMTTPDGKATEVSLKAGEVLWSDPVTHTVGNVGTTDCRAVVVELKASAAHKH